MEWFNYTKVTIDVILLWTFVNFIEGQRLKPDMGMGYNISTKPVLGPSGDTDSTAEPDTIKVTWINSTTSSIAVNWTFVEGYRSNGTFYGSHIEYFVKDGKFTSYVFPSNIHEYVIENLKTATKYTICVYMIESDPSITTHLGSKSHSQCLEISTIPYVRKDSILVLLLTLSYFCFMGSLGYSQWRRKLMYIRQKYRREVGDSPAESPRSSRWIDLQERVKLNNECSIEDAVRL